MAAKRNRSRPGQLAPDSESTFQLLRQAKGGDESALDRLYQRCLPPLQRWARGRLPHWARGVLDTDDVVQQTVVGSLGRLKQFDPEHSGAFHAYLRAGVLNRIRDEVRRVQRQPRRDGTPGRIEDDRPSPVEEAIGKETLAAYEGALERLKPVEREAVIARVELGMTYAEVAESLGKPSPDAARMAVARSLLQLARQMAVDE